MPGYGLGILRQLDGILRGYVSVEMLVTLQLIFRQVPVLVGDLGTGNQREGAGVCRRFRRPGRAYPMPPPHTVFVWHNYRLRRYIGSCRVWLGGQMRLANEPSGQSLREINMNLAVALDWTFRATPRSQPRRLRPA